MKTKYFLIMCIVLCLTVVGTIIIDKNLDYSFELNGVKITENQYDSIKKVLPNQEISICNIENKQCILMIPIN